MPRVRVTRVLEHPPATVWARLADIADHVSWMADAAAIRFVTDRREGVGTRFQCDTIVGPLKTVDKMEVTEWRPGEAMGVRHSGVVTGTGRFTFGAVSGGRTRLTWEEDLSFPWYLGGSLTAWLAHPVFRRLWAGNLARFAARVGPPDGEPGVDRQDARRGTLRMWMTTKSHGPAAPTCRATKRPPVTRGY